MMSRLSALRSFGALLAVAGIVWLAPLMADQLVLFADRDQFARAEAARGLMPWPSVLVAAGALSLAVAGRPIQGGVAALPLLAVGLAWAMPDAAWQLLVYGITAPLAIGAVLSTAIPIGRRVPWPFVLVAAVAVVTLVILAASILAVLAAIALAAWWTLSQRRRGRHPGPTLD